MKPEERKRERNRQEKRKCRRKYTRSGEATDESNTIQFDFVDDALLQPPHRQRAIFDAHPLRWHYSCTPRYSLGWRQERGDEGRDSLSLSLSLARGGEAPARSSQEPTTQKTHEDQGAPRKPREAQQQEDGAFTKNLLISHT